MDAWLEQFEARRSTRAAEASEVAVAGVILAVKVGIAPQVAINYYDAKHRLIAYYEERENASAANKPLPEIPDDLTDPNLLALVEETVRAILHPSSLAAWQQIRDPGAAVPLTWPDLFDLVEYLIGRASGVPTDGPSASADGPASTDTSSTDESSSTVAVSPV